MKTREDVLKIVRGAGAEHGSTAGLLPILERLFGTDYTFIWEYLNAYSNITVGGTTDRFNFALEHAEKQLKRPAPYVIRTGLSREQAEDMERWITSEVSDAIHHFTLSQK